MTPTVHVYGNDGIAACYKGNLSNNNIKIKGLISGMRPHNRVNETCTNTPHCSLHDHEHQCIIA